MSTNTRSIIKVKPWVGLFWTGLTIFVAGLLFISCSTRDNQDRLLVFTKTEGYRHASIPVGVEAIRELGKEHGVQVDHTEDAFAFEESNLQQYAAVIFLSTSGDVFNHYQQKALKRYIETGGGHTAENFSEPLFLQHLWGGIRYVLGEDLNNRLKGR